MQRLFIFLQYLLPQRFLSRLIGKIAEVQHPLWLKNGLIHLAVRVFNIDITEAQQNDLTAYPSFNQFFIRRLRSDIRPLASQGLISPVDGTISQIARIDEQQLIQAKGKYYSLSSLLAHDQRLTKTFERGLFTTLYLSPRDYHRVHMPLDGTLEKMIYVPGRLFSVNPITAQYIDDLFARNERVICVFNTALGKMAVIFVGAMLVAGVSTVWHGKVCPPQQREITVFNYPAQTYHFQRGDELGYFSFGSTVILLLPKDTLYWSSSWQAGDQIRFGQLLAQ